MVIDGVNHVMLHSDVGLLELEKATILNLTILPSLRQRARLEDCSAY